MVSPSLDDPSTTMSAAHIRPSTGAQQDGDSSSATSDDDSWHPSASVIKAFEPASAMRRMSLDARDQSIAATLPSELILEIFKFLHTAKDLHSCLLTCQTWCACSVEMLWYKPQLYTAPSMIKFLPIIRKEGLSFDYPSFIRRLNLSYLCEQIADAILMKLQRCKRLERLTLLGCKRVTDRGLADILSHNTGLIALDISGLDQVTDLSVLVAASRNKNLQGLNLTDCRNITDDAIVEIAQQCRNLRRIKLNNCIGIKDKSVQALADYSEYLLEIDLDHCHQVTSPAIANLIVSCAELRELRLNMCTQLNDSCFTGLQRDRYMNLRSLDLTGCSRITDDSVLAIVTAAPKLRTLVLAKCPNITDRGAVQIARLGKHIHFLHLGHCNQLTDRCVGFLAKYCNRLRYIDLACCTQLTDIAVMELNSLPRLKRIGLVKCSAITPQAIYSLLHRGIVQDSLERIHLSYCNNLQLDVRICMELY